MERVSLTGNDAVGTAMAQINPDVVAAFPITPQTELMHKFAEFYADGKVNTELILVESEHSAMSAVVGSAAAGARSMTATSANGFALMWEIVYIAASLRLPIVMPVVNRALSGPINIHCDHSDTMGGRDSGWVQLFSENTQEVYDNVIMAVKIAEHKDILLPVMATFDGFIISHTQEVVELLSDEEVQKFIGKKEMYYPLLDVKNPVTYGPLDLQDYYFEHKRQQVEAMLKVPAVVDEVAKDYAKLTGRKYDFIEIYGPEDAEISLVALGSTAGTAKDVVDKLNDEGKKVNLVKIRMFRPWPHETIVNALKGKKAIGIMDRSDSFGALGGPVFMEIRSSLMGEIKEDITANYIYGLGGRDISAPEIESVYNDLFEIAETGKVKNRKTYLGVRE
ncbi:MAG: pyruvate ferredoxin oxidoreductase [Acidobacteria bacterium]|nr:pyruvate ferredoxin oxidoreductase [Acidobacteriota bacterium]